MAGYLEIVVIAAIAQLTVLPGEKVQFIIAGLATRYDPLLVVGAAGTAFAGWTALEIAFGQAIQRLLPAIVLDGFTVALFLLFAVMLVRSAPAADAEWNAAGTADASETASGPSSAPGAGSPGTETDGGVAAAHRIAPDVDGEFSVFGRSIDGRLGTFCSIFALMAAGEFGDKTQLITISLAATYGATSAIWLGEMLVIVPVSLANAYAFHRFAHRIDLRKAHFVGAAIFAFFAADTLLAIATGFSVWEAVVGSISAVVVSVV
ncbi:TMEM165/GDT1 family protein [Salinarchaeum chitinilyticum]